jgi:hypothetical protein
MTRMAAMMTPATVVPGTRRDASRQEVKHTVTSICERIETSFD